jgi:hypothetical protein
MPDAIPGGLLPAPDPTTPLDRLLEAAIRQSTDGRVRTWLSNLLARGETATNRVSGPQSLQTHGCRRFRRAPDKA